MTASRRRQDGSGSGDSNQFTTTDAGVLYHPSARRSRDREIRAFSPDPSTFLDPPPDFDMIQELAHNRAAYLAEPGCVDHFTIRRFPPYLFDCMQKIAERVRQERSEYGKPGKGTILACALAHALPSFHESEEVQAIVEIQRNFRLHDFADAEVEDMVGSFLRSGSVELMLSDQDPKRTFPIPSGLGEELNELAEDLGLTKTGLGMLALMHSLSFQPAVSADRREMFSKQVAKFMRRLRWRQRGADALLKIWQE